MLIFVVFFIWLRFKFKHELSLTPSVNVHTFSQAHVSFNCDSRCWSRIYVSLRRNLFKQISDVFFLMSSIFSWSSSSVHRLKSFVFSLRKKVFLLSFCQNVIKFRKSKWLLQVGSSYEKKTKKSSPFWINLQIEFLKIQQLVNTKIVTKI
jgi:hypothetical protein